MLRILLFEELPDRAELVREGLTRAGHACFKVTESEVRAALAAGASFAVLQRDLKCGTNCGSCVPELRRLVAA